MYRILWSLIVWATTGAMVSLAPAATAPVQVTVQNLAPTNGIWLTPFWVGFHDGNFDSFSQGQPASAAVERVAEDGSTGQITAAFAGTGFGAGQATLLGTGVPGQPGAPPVIGPGTSATSFFNLESSDPRSRYFSYASMIIASNDAFVANGNPLAHSIFDGGGNFLGADFIVLGSQVWDAGTEVNDELPANTAFLAQSVDDTGVVENGLVHLHPGFRGSFANPAGPASILGGTNGLGVFFDPINADFTRGGYQVARVTVTLVPEPGSMLGLAPLLAPLLARRRRRAG
jgi:hypothetical protein